MGIFSKIGGAVGSLLSGGGLGEVLNVAKRLLPDNMSEAEKATYELELSKAIHTQEIELMVALTEDQKVFNQRINDTEGTAKDLMAVPIIGPLLILLRGAFRPVFAFAVAFFDGMVLSGTWVLADEQLTKMLWMINFLVLGFYFGERAIKNITPLIGTYFGNGKNK